MRLLPIDCKLTDRNTKRCVFIAKFLVNRNKNLAKSNSLYIVSFLKIFTNPNDLEVTFLRPQNTFNVTVQELGVKHLSITDFHADQQTINCL